jgi:hypothetical protein
VLTEEGARPNDVDQIMGWAPPDVKGRYYVRKNPNLHETIALLYKSDPIERRAESLQAVPSVGRRMPPPAAAFSCQ